MNEISSHSVPAIRRSYSEYEDACSPVTGTTIARTLQIEEFIP